MMEKFKLHLLTLVLALLLCAPKPSGGESSTCLMVYREGGAPAVFQSPKCPRWKLSNYASRPRTMACQLAMLQGRRRSQEDRTLCALDVRIPFLGTRGLMEVSVGIVAIFDGHSGAEASEMASKLLLEYFVLHTYFLLDATYSASLKKSSERLPNKGERDVFYQVPNWSEEQDWRGFRFSSSALSGGSFHLEILKESLLRAIRDIDAAFSKEASRKNLHSGTTATAILIADGQILVANVGDSKALLCSERFLSPAEAKATLLRLHRQRRSNGAISSLKDCDGFKSTISNELAHFFVKELTSDHHPDRDDERSRVESAGGYVLEWGGVFRVNGQLAVSRAIGDVPFKSYGVISAPEVTDWQPLTTNDSYLVAASDGIFEKLSPQDLCDILSELHYHGAFRAETISSCSHSMADCLVNTAFAKGSMDNLAAVVVPLRPSGSQTLMKTGCDREDDSNFSNLGLQMLTYEETGNNIPSEKVQLEHAHPATAKFDRLLVEGNHDSFACFYLSENLNEIMDSAFWAQKDDRDDLLQSLPEVLDHHSGGPLHLYKDQTLCLLFGMTADGVKDQCRNSEVFANFISLLESIPFHYSDPHRGSFEHDMPNLRYVLKKRFGRGSYGEVWLAFHWNCSHGLGASNWNFKNKNFSCNTIRLDSYDKSSQQSSSDQKCHAGPPDENLFILKRIMVERGTAVYLSGLREKYFGEVFLNASASLGGLQSTGKSYSFLNESESDLYNEFDTRNSHFLELGSTWIFEHVYQDKARLQAVVYEEGLNHIARYVESFESQSNEIWLVFHHEGVSLSKLIYTAEEIENNDDEERGQGMKHLQVLHPSKWWYWLKTTEAGQEEMRNIIWQLLKAIKSCHDRNITHRDIKPENMVICFEDQDTGRCLKGSPSGDKKYISKMRIIDFGSSIDEYTLKHLYGSMGPSRAEQTHEYTPPEALLNSAWYQAPISTTLKYDMWSVGVVILELILGSPNVFQISALTRTLLDHHLEGWNAGLKELAYKLRSFMEMCILMPGSSLRHHRNGGANEQDGVSPASWRCSEEFFSLHVKSRDPLKLGFPNVLVLRLVRELLLWDPDDRLSVDDALRHPYFHPAS